jgi:acyl-CoA thioester hydrolase
MQDLFTNFPVVVDIPVRWADMDPFQHVNNTVYFRYFEIARISYFERLDLIEFMQGKRLGPILGAIDCRFRFPITYPDTVSVGTRVVQMGEDRFVMEHRLVSQTHQVIAAEGNGTIVTFDYVKKTKAPIPEHARRLILDLESTSGNVVQPFARQQPTKR